MNGAPDPLGETVRSLFGDLRHAGELDAASGDTATSGDATRGAPAASGAAPRAYAGVLRGEAGRARQGTRVRFTLQMAGHRVLQARYRAYGCPYTLAACEWLARRLTGAELAGLSAAALTARVGAPAEWAGALGIPPERLGRLLVIEDALQAALAGAGGGSDRLGLTKP